MKFRGKGVNCTKMGSSDKANNFSILIVSEKPDTISIISRLLSSHGFRCLIAVNGSKAIDIIQESEIHLVITEMDLPDINGIQLTSYIKRLLPDTEVIIMDEPDKGFSTKELSSAVAELKPL